MALGYRISEIERMPLNSVIILRELSTSEKALSSKGISERLLKLRGSHMGEDTVCYYLAPLVDGGFVKNEGLSIKKQPTPEESGLAETVFAATKAGVLAMQLLRP